MIAKVGENWGLDEWYPRAPAKLKVEAIFGAAEEEPEKGAETPEEQVEIETPAQLPMAKGRKAAFAEFIRTHGPSTRAEILAGTGIPQGSFAYCANDTDMFIKGEDGKYRNVE